MESAWEIDRVNQMRRNPQHAMAAAIAAEEKKQARVEAQALQYEQEGPLSPMQTFQRRLFHGKDSFIKFLKFIGPGVLISVAYIDPDNFQSDVASGAQFEYKLLFMVLLGNIISIFLQSMSIKLGSVTGLDLAQMNRAHLPSWLNITLWILAEAAIICTDIGQVIGTAIALNLLCPKIPLVAGCAIAMADTLFILLFYRPWGAIRFLRAFEYFVGSIVIACCICFAILLSKLDTENVSAGEVLKGYLPSKTLFVGEGLYETCAIIGGTIMPHTIYLGSGIVQARMRDYDVKHKKYELPEEDDASTMTIYRPSLDAIKSTMKYSIAELCSTLFIIAVFVNSAIMIVAAANFDEDAEDADLFGVYELFQDSISAGAATLFALGLLFSGTSSGIVATMAGQMICEGAMNWRLSPFMRRLVTRSIAIIPSIVIAAAVGRKGLAAALNGTNVVLSVELIFVTAPLLYYTSRDKYMMVPLNGTTTQGDPIKGMAKRREDAERERDTDMISMANSWFVCGICALCWLIIAFLNVALWVLLGLGKIDDL